MDIDRINAICAEIDAGAKSFGKNREWDFAAGNDTGFSFSGKGKDRAAAVTLARHEYDAVEDSVRRSAGDGRLIPSALRLYSLVRA